MYYEEKMIDGFLHWRSDPNGVWIAYTARELSERIQRLSDMVRGVVDTQGVPKGEYY